MNQENKYTAEVCIDADENRVVWQVLVYDNDECVDKRPFRDRQDAEEYAESVRISQLIT